MSKPIGEYPVHGLMPKQDTQAAGFIKKYPESDGRGTVVAILDTGVDPGAAGMQVTTDGQPKIIDIVDCTGGGDVTTTKIVKPVEEQRDNDKVSVIRGQSGRSLIIDPSWKNPSGEYRVGVKRAYELFPTELVARLKKERREQFELKHGRLLSDAQTQLAEFRKANPNTTKDEQLTEKKSDLEARVEALKEILNSYEDPGMIYDCVVFHDGENWRAVIDVNESGDLRGAPCMTDYRKELQYHTFGKADLLNFSVNIYDNGDLLSIVTLSGSHGTHVAGIVAANFPDEPELNGVAPGAQLISLRIGDSRLGSMETCLGLTRAATHLAINKVDLANMSYGESSSLPSDGHFIRLLAEEVISKSGCLFVTSAGNDGPCYSSIGAPAGMSSSFVTVGAYVKHAQMEAEYALLEPVGEKPYTWSSRGPCTDGYQGVDIYAPGSAITSVPVYGLHKLDLKNGTSMSSPNACGCIALLVSALKREQASYTPYRLKTAVVQSAKSVDDPLNVGFIQVDKAWEYLKEYKDRKDLDIMFEVTVMKRGSQRGIYLREHEETNQTQYLTTRVRPKFMGEIDPENPKNNMSKFEFEARVALVTTASWVSAPDFVYIASTGNAFQVKVDPSSLGDGQFHYSEVLGYDTSAPERGPLFKIPVSVAKPTVPANGSIGFPNIEFGPGDIIRRFLHVPEGATYAKLTLRSKSQVETCPARFMLHLLQLVPQKNQKKKQTYTFLLGSGSFGNTNSEDQVITVRFAVRGGLNLEVCLAQFWSGLGRHFVDLEVDFHGIQLAGNQASGDSTLRLEPQVTRLDVMAPVRKETKVDISASFSTLRKYLRASEAEIAPLKPERNTLPNSRIMYGLVLTYNVKIENSTTITPRFPTVMNQLYEHFLGGVFGIIYDANRKIVGYFDVFDHKFKLDVKGDYTIMLQLVGEDEKVLEKLKTTICELDMSVKSINFTAYATMAGVFKGEKSSISKTGLEKREPQVCYLAPPMDDQQWLPKEAKAGDALVGKLGFTKEKVDGGQYEVLYTIPPEAKQANNNNNGGGKDAKPGQEKLEEQLADALRDLRISYLDKFEGDAQKSLLSKLESDYANDIVFLQSKIDRVWKQAGGSTECLGAAASTAEQQDKLSKEQADEIVQLSDKIANQIDKAQLIEFYGRYPQEDPQQSDDIAEQRKENDKKKQKLVNALKNKTWALACVSTDKQAADGFEASFKELKQWAPQENDIGMTLAKVKRERIAGRLGSALKVLNKFISDVNVKSDTVNDLQQAWKVRQSLYSALGWSICLAYDQSWSVIRSPPGGYAPF